MKFGHLVICPKCDAIGFVTIRYVRSSYTPRRSKVVEAIKSSFYATLSHKSRENGKSTKIDQFEYWSDRLIRGPSRNGIYIKELPAPQNENALYKVYTKTYYHLYVGHYDCDKYELRKIDYDQGCLKYRPNGRKWCYVLKNSNFVIPPTADSAGFTIGYDDLKKHLLL
jgi:hypothetical protein